MTTKDDIRRWLEAAKEHEATHLMVVCDTFEWEDYPVFVEKGDDVNKVFVEHSTNMQKVMEVYRMDMDIEEQMNKGRAMNL